MASAERAIESAVQKLGQLLIDEIIFVNEVHSDVYWMRSELRWMNCFLKDADAKGQDGDMRTKNWIREVTDIAHEAEDVVDTFMLRFETMHMQTNGLFSMLSCRPSKLVDLHYIGNKILRIKSKIHCISESKGRYGIENLVSKSSGSTDEKFQVQRNINPYLSGDKTFVEFRSQKKLILEHMLDFKVKKRSVVSIVGMGGLGKTTFATQIYKTSAIEDWFNYQAWVTVSQGFNRLELLKKLIKRVEGYSKNYNDMDITELEFELQKCLEKIRYLIVLDDIWGQDVWQQLRDVFPDVENGSRILITTRNIDVAKSADPSTEPFELPFLSHRKSWELFLNVVFPSEDGTPPECPKVLQDYAEQIVKKCGGLPLGIKTIGGLLSVTNPTVNAWQEVAENWKEKDKSLQHILALSYKSLSNVNMKSCFLYIGNYPEDYIIKASEVAKFWIAEGFIPKVANQTFEETAKDYLDEFVLRCMVQVVDRTKTSKRVKHFRIHDLFRKWCISEAQEDGFFRICTSNSDTSDPEIIAARRLTVYESITDDKFCDLSYNARAVLVFNCQFAGNFLLKNIGHNFKLLRVIYLNFPMDVKNSKSKLLKEISRLIHLRNITFISKALKYLPSSIGKLHNLQTLNIKNTSIWKLPKTIYRIHNLRHLYTRGITIGPSVIWMSRNLQTLDSISVGSWMPKDFTKLLNLRKLSISGITQNGVIGLQDSLHRLNHLKSLCLESDGQTDPSLFTSFKSHNPLSKLVLINWSNVSSVFPQTLISIRLSGCTFEKGVIVSLEKLPSLANLNLEDCGIHSEDEFVCSANGFHQLENLQIGKMHSSLDWRIVNGALPKIKYLMIRASDWLEMLPVGLEHLKSLQKLEMVEFKENLKKRLLDTLEDRHKIPQITYVTLNGIQLDQHSRSSDMMHVKKMKGINDEAFLPTPDDEPILPTKDDEAILSTQDDEPFFHMQDDEQIISPLVVERRIRGRTKVTVNRKMEAPLGESKYKVMLEVTGMGPDGDRPGVDFVTVLDVGRDSLENMKVAMKFFLKKLNSNDRLCIVECSSLSSLRMSQLQQMTESNLVDVEILVSDLRFTPVRNINHGIRYGLQILNSRRFTTGRMATFVLISDGISVSYNPTPIQLLNFPVHAFGLGKEDMSVLKKISDASMGGTYSYIRNTDDLSIAFSQCFTALFGVAASDLKLTVKQFKSTIQTVFADNCTQSTDNTSGSSTISFGDVYVDELRKVTVDLRLLAVRSPCSDDVLEITLSAADEVVHPPIRINVTRTDSDDTEER